MAEAFTLLQNVCEAVVFGNGWLALGGLLVVTGGTVAVRLSRGIQV